MSLADTIIPDKYNPNASDGVKLVREWRQKKPRKTGHTRAGEVLMFTYKAQTNVDKYDVNPVAIVLRARGNYILAFNINWLERRDRDRLVNFLVNIKFHEMSNNQRMALTLKLRKLNYTKDAYRLYIRKGLKRIYKLDVNDFYVALRHNLKNVVEK